jgi:hypothetical protein
MNQGFGYYLEKLLTPSQTDLFGLSDVILAMTVSALLCYALTEVYRHTHRGTSYSQSFMVTMFMMAVGTSVVMLIIGSNIARAFSLVGALSIIRFRTAVKDARDTGFLFAAMIAGMGCGTSFYLASITMTVFVSVLLLVLHAANYGLKQKLETVARVTYKVGDGSLDAIEKELGASFREVRLINRILDFGDGHETNVYVIRPGKSGDTREAEERLRKLDSVVKLSFYQSDQHAPF